MFFVVSESEFLVGNLNWSGSREHAHTQCHIFVSIILCKFYDVFTSRFVCVYTLCVSKIFHRVLWQCRFENHWMFALGPHSSILRHWHRLKIDHQKVNKSIWFIKHIFFLFSMCFCFRSSNSVFFFGLFHFRNEFSTLLFFVFSKCEMFPLRSLFTVNDVRFVCVVDHSKNFIFYARFFFVKFIFTFACIARHSLFSLSFSFTRFIVRSRTIHFRMNSLSNCSQNEREERARNKINK